MTLSNDLIEPQQWYRWHNRGAARHESDHTPPPSRFHFGDLIVRDLSSQSDETDDAAARIRERGFGDVSVTFRCHGVVQIQGEQFTMAQLGEDESLLTFTVRVVAGNHGPAAELVAQFMTGDFAGLDTTDPSAALSDFELRARGEALAFVQRGDESIDSAALSRQLGVSQRRLNRAFRNTGNSVRATLRCE